MSLENLGKLYKVSQHFLIEMNKIDEHVSTKSERPFVKIQIHNTPYLLPITSKPPNAISAASMHAIPDLKGNITDHLAYYGMIPFIEQEAHIIEAPITRKLTNDATYIEKNLAAIQQEATRIYGIKVRDRTHATGWCADFQRLETASRKFTQKAAQLDAISKGALLQDKPSTSAKATKRSLTDATTDIAILLSCDILVLSIISKGY